MSRLLSEGFILCSNFFFLLCVKLYHDTDITTKSSKLWTIALCDALRVHNLF